MCFGTDIVLFPLNTKLDSYFTFELQEHPILGIEQPLIRYQALSTELYVKNNQNAQNGNSASSLVDKENPKPTQDFREVAVKYHAIG